jgi:hypothetical protein
MKLVETLIDERWILRPVSLASNPDTPTGCGGTGGSLH